jgi:hypothetical protein
VGETAAVVEWRGASGARYAYWSYQLPEVPDQEAIGSYIFARRGDDGGWVPVFFGHGDLATLGEGVHALWANIRTKGATHVHTHRNARVAGRREEEADLLAAHPEAWAPSGCNQREEPGDAVAEPGREAAPGASPVEFEAEDAEG